MKRTTTDRVEPAIYVCEVLVDEVRKLLNVRLGLPSHCPKPMKQFIPRNSTCMYLSVLTYLYIMWLMTFWWYCDACTYYLLPLFRTFMSCIELVAFRVPWQPSNRQQVRCVSEQCSTICYCSVLLARKCIMSANMHVCGKCFIYMQSHAYFAHFSDLDACTASVHNIYLYILCPPSPSGCWEMRR